MEQPEVAPSAAGAPSGSHLRFMFPSQDPSSHRPATKNPGTNLPSPMDKLPPLGLNGSGTGMLSLTDGSPPGSSSSIQRRRRVQKSRSGQLEAMRSSWPATDVEPPPVSSPTTPSPKRGAMLVAQQSGETSSFDLGSPSYLHYDVLVDWEKDPMLDTSPFSPQMQEYTRLYYTRQPGQHRKLRPMSDRPMSSQVGLMNSISEGNLAEDSRQGPGTFSLTEANLDLKGDDDLLDTDVPLDLWYQYASQGLSDMDLHKLRDWASKLRPRSIQDLKPMLILCQALLKDLLQGKLAHLEKEMVAATQRISREHESASLNYQHKIEVMRKEMTRMHSELSELRKKTKMQTILQKVTQHSSRTQLAKAAVSQVEANETLDELTQLRSSASTFTEEKAALENQVKQLNSRLEVSMENYRAVQQKHNTLQQHVKELRAWYKQSLSSLEAQVEMHLLPSHEPMEPRQPSPSKQAERKNGSEVIDSPRATVSPSPSYKIAKPYGKSKASKKIKQAKEEAEVIENADIVNPQVLDNMRDAENEEDVYKAAIDLLRETAGEEANLAVVPGDDGEMLLFGTVPAPSGEDETFGSARNRQVQDGATLAGLARIETLLQDLNHSMNEAEETRDLKAAMAKNQMLVAGGKNRKWMAIPMAAKRIKGGSRVAAIVMQSKIPQSISQNQWERLSGEAREASKMLAATGRLPEEMLVNLTEEEVAILMEQKAVVEENMLTEEQKTEITRARTINRQFTPPRRSDRVHGLDMDDRVISELSEQQRIARLVHALTMRMFKNVLTDLGLDTSAYTDQAISAKSFGEDAAADDVKASADTNAAAGAASVSGTAAMTAKATPPRSAARGGVAGITTGASTGTDKTALPESDQQESGPGGDAAAPSSPSNDWGTEVGADVWHARKGHARVRPRGTGQDGRDVDLSRGKSVKSTTLLSGVSLKTVVTEDGRTVYLMHDADGKEMPVLLDDDGNAVLDEDGNPMAGVVVDSEGRQLVGEDGQAVEVIVDEKGSRVAAVQLDASGAVVVGEDGAPVVNSEFEETAARMERARSERRLESQSSALEGDQTASGEGGSGDGSSTVREGHGDAVLDEIRDASGEVVQPDTSGLVTVKSMSATGEANEQYFMHDADGKAIPVLTDNQANPVRNKDGKPVAGVVLDADGRLLLNREGQPIDVCMHSNGVLYAMFAASADGGPDVAATVHGAPAPLEVTLVGDYYPGPRLMPARRRTTPSVDDSGMSGMAVGDSAAADDNTAALGASEGDEDEKDAGSSVEAGGKEGSSGKGQDGRGVDLGRAKSIKTKTLAGGMSMKSVVTEEGNTVYLMHDADGNEMPILLDDDGNAVLDEEGNPMAGVVVDSEGRQLLGADGNAIEVILDEGGSRVAAVQLDATGAAVLGEDGAPVVNSEFEETAERMEKAKSMRSLPNVAEEDEDSEGERVQDEADEAEIEEAGRVTMTTKSGFAMELAVDEDGEVLTMDGKAVAAVKDEEGNVMLMAADGGVVMTDFDGKPILDAEGNMIKVDQTGEGAMLSTDNSAVQKRDTGEEASPAHPDFTDPLTIEDMQQRQVRVAPEAGVLRGQQLDVADSHAREIRVHTTPDGRRFLADEDSRPVINRQTGRPVQVAEDGSVLLPGLGGEAKARIAEMAECLQGADGESIQAAKTEAIARKKSMRAVKQDAKAERRAAKSAAAKEKKTGGGGGEGKAEVAPEVQALLLVDDGGRAFIEDANGNHVRVFINDKGETVMADENGDALVDDEGQPIMVPFSEDGKADITMLPKSHRDVVQEKGHTLSDAEPLPEAVKADLDAFELEKVVQFKTLSAFVGWCANRAGKKGGRAADNEFLDELEEVISSFRTVHVAQPWRNRAQLARITSVRVQERIDHLRTIRTTILKELDKNRTLQQLQELKQYRDPPKAAATCINAVLLILGDPNVAEFVEPALNSVPITSHPNALKSLWKMMKPVIIDTAFTSRLNACDTTGDDEETTSRCKASNFTLMQVTPQEAKRVSKVVALMRHWVELQLLIHEQALEYRRTHSIPAGKQIEIAPRAKKSLLDSMPPPV